MKTARKIGANMRRRREERGLTQKELADRAGVSSSALSTIENGLSWGNLYTICALAGVLGLTVDEYIGRGAAAARARTAKEGNQ